MRPDDYSRGILKIASQTWDIGVTPPAGVTPRDAVHKINLIGRGEGHHPGELESLLNRTFNHDERAHAAEAFEALKRDGYIQATYTDTHDPENWVRITSSGRDFLARDMRDYIDEGLIHIGAQLVELRHGMWDAIDRNSPDAPRQAAHSARELIDQTLKEGAPGLATRKERFKYLMQKKSRGSGRISKSDLKILEAASNLIEAEHDKMTNESHSRSLISSGDVRASVEAAERIMGLLFSQ